MAFELNPEQKRKQSDFKKLYDSFMTDYDKELRKSTDTLWDDFRSKVLECYKNGGTLDEEKVKAAFDYYIEADLNEEKAPFPKLLQSKGKYYTDIGDRYNSPKDWYGVCCKDGEYLINHKGAEDEKYTEADALAAFKNLLSLVHDIITAEDADKLKSNTDIQKAANGDDKREGIPTKNIVRYMIVLESMHKESNYFGRFPTILNDGNLGNLADALCVETKEKNWLELGIIVQKTACMMLLDKEDMSDIKNDAEAINKFKCFTWEKIASDDRFKDSLLKAGSFSNMNVILHGAPGTGKTYSAANEITHYQVIDPDKYAYGDLKPKFIQFHPSYTYQDFIEGIKPAGIENGNLKLEPMNGSFKQFCIEVRKKNEDYFNGLAEAQAKEEKREYEEAEKRFIELAEKLIKETDDENVGKNVIELAEKLIKEKKTNDENVKKLDVLVKGLAEKEKKYNEKVDAARTELREKYNKKNPDAFNEWPHYFFIVDEINRGNLSNIFGETFTLLEYRDYDFSRRGDYNDAETGTELVETLLSTVIDKDGNDDLIYKRVNGRVVFGIPFNIHFIGMMNDVDRSIDSFDLALRRRFSWTELSCDYDVIRCTLLNIGFKDYFADDLANSARRLNDFVTKDEKLGKKYEIGHAFFLKIKDIASEKDINNDRVITYEDKETLFDERIAGTLREYFSYNSNSGEAEIDEKVNTAKERFVSRSTDTDSIEKGLKRLKKGRSALFSDDYVNTFILYIKAFNYAIDKDLPKQLDQTDSVMKNQISDSVFINEVVDFSDEKKPEIKPEWAAKEPVAETFFDKFTKIITDWYDLCIVDEKKKTKTVVDKTVEDIKNDFNDKINKEKSKLSKQKKENISSDEEYDD